jgi:DNA-binding XRE family transcriptional regulator
MTFSEKIREVRGRLYLTQQALAKELGVDYTTVNRWEGGKCEPSFLATRRFDDFCKERGIIFNEDKQ